MSLHSTCSKRLLRSIDRTFCWYYSQRKLTNGDVHKKRSALFEEEKKRQQSLITRIEKIKVTYKGLPEDVELVMNKDLSSPYHCAMHMNQMMMDRSALALVNDQPWDMYRPLEEDCTLQLLHFMDEDPTLLNEVYWRSCSFILGYIMERAFKEDYFVQLCSFPPPDLKSGSFVYDVDLKDLPADWKISETELNCLSRMGYKLSSKELEFERLVVSEDLASEMFADNQYKHSQIPHIAKKSENGRNVTLYRLGDHVDISKGPMIGRTSFIGLFSIPSIHKYNTQRDGYLHRVQGVSVPSYLMLHYWTFEQLCKRAKLKNTTGLFAESGFRSSRKKNGNGEFKAQSTVNHVHADWVEDKVPDEKRVEGGP